MSSRSPAPGPSHAADGATRDVLARALDTRPATPPPPPFARVMAAVRARAQPARRRFVLRRALPIGALAAAALVALAGLRQRRPPTEERVGTTPGLASSSPGVRVLASSGVVGTGPASVRVRRTRAGAADPAPPSPRATLLAGDEVTAVSVAVLRLRDGDVTATLEPGTVVVLDDDPSLVHQHAGRAAYHVERAGPTPWRVRAGGVEVVDLSTRFTVDLSGGDLSEELGGGVAPSGRRVLVWVDEGGVLAGGEPLRQGRGRTFVDGLAAGADWPADARPALSLEVETTDATTTAPVVVRIVLENPTDVWMSLPGPWAPGAGASDGHPALWVEATGPDDVVRPVRVTEAMRLPGGPASAIPPRGRVVLRVQFDRTFTSPGTYRLRAVFRPADAVDPPRSADVSLHVR